MKRISSIFYVILIMLSLVGCSSAPSKEEEEVLWDAKPSVMIDGVLYGTSGRSGIYSTDTTPENGGHVDGDTNTYADRDTASYTNTYADGSTDTNTNADTNGTAG